MITLTHDGKPLMIGGRFLQLGATVVAEPPPPPPTGVMPAANLAGWWDAGVLATGASTIPDSSGSGKNAVASGNSAKVHARMAGLLGGIFAEGGISNYTVYQPYVHDFSVNANTIAVGTGQKFTVFIVWSRPHQRQPNGGAFSTADVSLLSIGGTPVLALTAAGDGADSLKLFPAGSPVTGGALPLRHTHSARVVFDGATVDVWLDGAKVITGAANQITLGATANLSFLANAALVFHEAAAWSAALGTAAHADLTAYSARWPLGERPAANGLIIGQSNAENFGTFNANQRLNTAVRYWTGALASNIILGPKIGATSTKKFTFSGSGSWNLASSGLFLDATSGAANVDNWPLGTQGQIYMAAIDAIPADQRANIRYVFLLWTESDSGMLTYALKGTHTAAMKRIAHHIRTKLSRTAAQLPIMVINALPYGNDEGRQTHREAMADFVADPANNAHWALTQTDDAIGQSATYDAATGQETGTGDNAHRDSTGINAFALRAAIPIGRAVLAAHAANGKPDKLTAFDPSVPVSGGPKMISAQYEGTAHAATGTVLVTVAHDGGSDLVVPLRAALGVGWALMDGVNANTPGTPAAPGAIIRATACVRVSSTQLRVTLASLPAFPGNGLMYYDYGRGLDANAYAIIGRGNAVTDNLSAVTLAAGWRIGQDLGATSQPNLPLQATTYGIPLT